jgi:cystathionine beta-synthase
VQIIGADPEGSVYSGGTGRPYLVEGVGEDFWPTAYDPSVVDQIIASSDAESFALTLRLAREEGLLVGGSSGLAVSAALKAARELPADAVIVVLLPDGGRGYLGKIFNDEWMRSYGFASGEHETSVRDVLTAKTGHVPDLVHALPGTTVRDAVATMQKYGVSQLLVLANEPPVVMGEVLGQLLVLANEPPVVMGEVLGALDERELLDLVFSGRAQLGDPVGGVVGAPLGLIGEGASVSAARTALGASDALLVTEGGKPIAVLTRSDLLSYLSA